MMNRTPRHVESLVQWTFEFGNDLLTCGIERYDDAQYVISIVPNGRSRTPMIERADSLVAALHRHAAIAAHLRDHGWSVVGYAGTHVTAERHQEHAA